MIKLSIWIARGILAFFVVFAVLGLIDPAQRLAEVQVHGDRLNHGFFSYAITLGLIASFHRFPAWLFAIGVMLVGVGVEVVQGLGFFAGDAEFGDLVADATGIILALVPVLIGKARMSAKLGRPDAV